MTSALVKWVDRTRSAIALARSSTGRIERGTAEEIPLVQRHILNRRIGDSQHGRETVDADGEQLIGHQTFQALNRPIEREMVIGRLRSHPTRPRFFHDRRRLGSVATTGLEPALPMRAVPD